MKILVAIRDSADAIRISDIVRGLGHNVSVANQGREVAMTLARSLPHVVFVDASILMPSGREIVRHIRKLVSTHYIYIILFSKDDNPPQLVRQYEAGVDNEIEPPVSPHQIEAKLYAAQRILAFEESLRRRVDAELGDARKTGSFALDTGVHSAHVSKASDRSTQSTTISQTTQVFVALTPGEVILRSAAWRALQETFRAAIARFLLVDFEAGSKASEAPTHVYRIVLSNQTKQLELHLFLASTHQNIKEISSYMFGQQEESSESRVLEGLSQMLSVALQDSLATEHLKFAEINAGEYSTGRLQKECKQMTESLFFSLGELHFSVYVNLRFKGNSVLPITALQEGMLLGKDILNNKGLLLLSKGTRISSMMKERLCDCLPQTHMVEVTCE